MQEEFDLVENRHRPSPTTRAGCPMLMTLALLVAGLAVALFYINFAQPWQEVEVTYQVWGEANQARVQYDLPDGQRADQWVTLPWMMSLTFAELGPGLGVDVVDLEGAPRPLHCAIRLDGVLQPVDELEQDGELRCSLAP